MKNSISIFVLFSFVSAFIMVGCNNGSSEKSNVQHLDEKVLYQCPMDCESGKTYSDKLTCPVCEMDLEKADSPV